MALSKSNQINNSKVIFAVFLGYIIHVYNKKCLVPLFPHIIHQFNLTEQDAGLIQSSQQVSLSLLTFFGGILTDYLPVTWMFSSGLIIAGFTTILFPFANGSVRYFCFIWFLNGLGHGLELPTALYLTKKFSSVDSFATNWSFVMTAVNIAGTIISFTSTFLYYFFGLFGTLILTGFMTLIVGISIFFCMEKEERKLEKIEDSKGKENKKPVKSFQWIDVIFPSLGLVVLNRFTIGLSRLAVRDWSELFFLSNEMQLNNPYYASLFITTFESSSIIGKLLSGRINDYYMKKSLIESKKTTTKKNPVQIRLPIAIGFNILAVFGLILYCKILNANSSILLFILVPFIFGLSTSGNVITFSLLSTEISDERYQGLITSICNLATKVGSLFSAYPFTLLVGWIGWYQSFTFLAAFISLTLIFDVIFHFKRWNETKKIR